MHDGRCEAKVRDATGRSVRCGKKARSAMTVRGVKRHLCRKDARVLRSGQAKALIETEGGEMKEQTERHRPSNLPSLTSDRICWACGQVWPCETEMTRQERGGR